MPYNTGDFTQQGVAGYVNGGLLLNNKRDVTARISTDEESAGIDNVDIKIKDRLNDIEYHITGENLTEGENVIGGGGGASYNKLTVKFVNISDEYSVENKYLKPLQIIDSKMYISGTALNIVPLGEIENDFLYLRWEEGGDFGYVVELPDIVIDSAEDPVNCEYDSGSIRIINGTQDASITLNVVGGR